MIKPYINIHSHRKAQLKNELVIRNAYHFDTNLYYPISVGLHPYHINKYNLILAINTITKNITKPNVFAIGECGLDKTTGIDMGLQKEIFIKHIELALHYKKPVIVHCVRAYEMLMPLIKQHKINFILHGYNGNQEQNKQFLKMDNVYFSFGKYMYNPSQKYLQSIRQIPLEKTFLETDNSNLYIDKMYATYAIHKGISLDKIMKQICETYAYIFQK